MKLPDLNPAFRQYEKTQNVLDRLTKMSDISAVARQQTALAAALSSVKLPDLNPAFRQYEETQNALERLSKISDFSAVARQQTLLAEALSSVKLPDLNPAFRQFEETQNALERLSKMSDLSAVARQQAALAERLSLLNAPGLGRAETRDSAGTSTVTSDLESSELMDQSVPALSQTDMRRLRVQIGQLEEQLAVKARALHDAIARGEQAETEAGAYKAQLDELESRVRLAHLLDRVSPDARELLLKDSASAKQLREGFEKDKLVDSFVLSIDIRRSTDLMLKAKEPRLFAEFVTGLCTELRAIIVRNYGVFDKFTGDGVLAFFPDFYSGQNAGLLAVRAATDCQEAFERHYRCNRRCFSSVITETGLGIGIDYGKVQLVLISGDLTIVGNPVVYACRMGAAPAGKTLVNQPAYEQLFDHFSADCDFVETMIDFKHEGGMVAYSVKLNGKPFVEVLPSWHAKMLLERSASSTPQDEHSDEAEHSAGDVP